MPGAVRPTVRIEAQDFDVAAEIAGLTTGRA
ncbi:molybdopterin synthase catalytic subunit, partial [Mesorhizobium sp. M4B.F.Ca.ET.089.01.1.1]